MSEDISKIRSQNRLRRLFLLLAYLKAKNYGKSIMALLLSRGRISESSVAALTGMSLLNSRAVISSLLSLGLLHIVGEKQLRMKNRRRYVEIIFGIDPTAAGRVLREILANILGLLKSIYDIVSMEQLVYYCPKDIAIFLESDVDMIEYRCPICGEPLEPVWISVDKIDEFIEKIKGEFRKAVTF